MDNETLEAKYVLTDLGKNPEFYDELINLIEKEFHYSHTHSFAKDFAPLINPLNFENCFIIIDEKSNKLLSHLAICPRTMIKKNKLLNVGLIGGIVTDYDYRKQGLFKTLMNHALSQTEDRCGLYLLWSDLGGLYEKFSFHLAGGLVETGNGVFSDQNKPPGFQKTTYGQLEENDFEDIVKIYTEFNEKYFFTIKREEKDWSIIKDMDSIDLFIKRNENGKIENYFCVNKGRDLANIIHEIGSTPDKYLALVKQIKSYQTWLPESEVSLVESKNVFYTAYMKLGNINILNKFFDEVTNGSLKIKIISDDQVEFIFNSIEHKCSVIDFKNYLFGPKPLQEFEPFLLSPYIAGCDSI